MSAETRKEWRARKDRTLGEARYRIKLYLDTKKQFHLQPAIEALEDAAAAYGRKRKGKRP